MVEHTYDKGEWTSITRDLRLDILEMTTRAGSGHPSSSFSAVEIVTALYFGGVMRYRSHDPHWPERDRFILSKGHAAPLLYAALSRAGYFPHSMLEKLREIDSPVQGHPVKDMLPGVESTNGSLGQGLSFGLGCVLGGRLTGKDFHAFVLMGDGECQEGQVWEAAMAASHFKANRLIGIIDYNKYQECGPIDREMALEPLRAKWEAFGWRVEEVGGHDTEAVISKLQRLRKEPEKPGLLIAHTVKGKGVSFVEADYTFHGRVLSPEQAAKARKEITSCS